jgi:spore coat polysaccharide biosynthesis protein SpsF
MAPIQARAGLFLVARTGSTRLPRKSLIAVAGKPMLAHQIEKLQSARHPSVFALATTELPEDDALCEVAAAYGVATFRGARHDVLARLLASAEHFGVGVLVSVGGDDVFCEGSLVDSAIDALDEKGADFLTFEDVPFGTTPIALRVAALRRVMDMKEGEFTDGWDRFFTETGCFSAISAKLGEVSIDHPELRLDLDYPEDLTLVRQIYARLYDGKRQPSLAAVVRLLTQEAPELTSLNAAAHVRWLRGRRVLPLRLRPTAGAVDTVQKHTVRT